MWRDCEETSQTIPTWGWYYWTDTAWEADPGLKFSFTGGIVSRWHKTNNFVLFYFACSSLVIYGIRIVGFHARKGPIIGCPESIKNQRGASKISKYP